MAKKGKRAKKRQVKKNRYLSPSTGRIIRPDGTEIVSDSPDDKVIAVRKIESYRGPLPTPADFEKYNRVVPGAGNRILRMAEREQKMRDKGQTQILANDTKRINGATYLGIGMLVVAGIAAWQGSALIALPMGLAGFISTLLRRFQDWWEARTKSKD